MIVIGLRLAMFVTINALENGVCRGNVVALQARQPGMGSGGDRKIQCVMVPRGGRPTVGCVARLARIGKGCRQMIGSRGCVICRLVASKACRRSPRVAGRMACDTACRQMLTGQRKRGGCMVERRW